MTEIDISAKGEELGETHWKYVEKLLRVHGEKDEVIPKIKFHYIQAMKHGYKHGDKDGYKRGLTEKGGK